MADPGVSLDSWPAIIVGLAAAGAGLLVPLNGFIKTLLDYRLEARRAEKLQDETARQVVATTGTAVLDSLALQDLTDAIKDLATAIREDTESDKARHNNQLTSVLARLTERLDELDSDPGRHHGQHRGSRRDSHHR